MPRKVEVIAPPRPAYFWWLLANLLALCFAVASWTVCLHVFGNPEIPRNYKLLSKLGRAPELKHHTVLDAPSGNLLDPEGLYRRFFGLTEEQFGQLNSQLLRNYLTNFDRTQLLTYVEGEYLVENIRTLTESDLLSSGFAIRARAQVKPDDFTKAAPYPVVIEYVFPTQDAKAAGKFHKGDILSVSKTPNCAAILHAGKILDGDDPCVCLTVVPIAYGPYKVSDDFSFEISPPVKVNPGAAFPLFKR